MAMLTGVSLVVGYTLLGASWLNMKTEGRVQERARRLAFRFAGGMLVAIAAVSAATPFLDAEVFAPLILLAWRPAQRTGADPA